MKVMNDLKCLLFRICMLTLIVTLSVSGLFTAIVAKADTNGFLSQYKSHLPTLTIPPDSTDMYYNWVFVGVVLIMIAMALPVIEKMIKAKRKHDHDDF